MLPARPEPQGRDWARGLDITCNGEPVRSAVDAIPSNITSVEHSNDYNTNTWEYTDEDWEALGAALSESEVLTKLSLANLSKKEVEALFGAGRTCRWPQLKHLSLCGGLGIVGVRKIVPILNQLPTLDKLDLSHNHLGIMAAKLLAKALDHTQINDLLLTKNDIKDEGLELILSARNARHLVKLYIDGVQFGDRVFESLCHFLRREDILLRLLSVDTFGPRYSNRERRTQMLAESIPRTSKLEAITLTDYSNKIDDGIHDCLFHLVCDVSTIESVLRSNHRLCSLTVQSDESRYRAFNGIENYPKLTKALEINMQVQEGGSIANAIRRKLRNFYFERPDFDVQYFNDMDVALMPYLLNLMLFAESQEESRECWNRHENRVKPYLVPRDNLNAIYRLLRNCHVSEMFSFPSLESLMSEKDDQVEQLEAEVTELESEYEGMKQKIEQLEAENEELRSAGSLLPNKRARTGDVESRLAALEADVEMLKGSRS